MHNYDFMKGALHPSLLHCSWRRETSTSSADLIAAPTSSVLLPPNVTLAEDLPLISGPVKEFRHVPFPPPKFTIQKQSSVDMPIFPFMKETETISTIALKAHVFDAPLRKDILQRVVKWQLAKRRQGTHKTKSRSEVSGSTRKAWKQKGSGRARVGDIRAAQWRGGYTVHGKSPRDYSYPLPKKVRSMGLRVALSAKLREGKLAVVDDFLIQSSKAKTMHSYLTEQNWDHVLFVHGEKCVNDHFTRSIRNLPYSEILHAEGINVYSLLKKDIVLISQNAAQQLQARLDQ